MPLSEKVRIEVYVPDAPHVSYHRLLQSLNEEFTYSFGGATILRGLDGSFLSGSGMKLTDRISIIYTDLPLSLAKDADSILQFTEAVHDAVVSALSEEAVLVAIHPVFHVQWESTAI